MGPLGAVPREPRRWVDEAMATGDGTGRSVCFSVPPGGVPALRQGRHTRSRLSLEQPGCLPACWGEEWPAGVWGQQPPEIIFPKMPHSLLWGSSLAGARDPRGAVAGLPKCPHGVIKTRKCAICDPAGFRREYGQS